LGTGVEGTEKKKCKEARNSKKCLQAVRIGSHGKDFSFDYWLKTGQSIPDPAPGEFRKKNYSEV
jgi:hypothetical protein